MENPYGPDPSSPEQRPTYVRPPGLEFTMGIALFIFILMVFFLVQAIVFFLGVVEYTPAYPAFTFDLLQETHFQERMQELAFNGDLVAREALWSGFVGLVLIMAGVGWWKRRNAAIFLGLVRVNIRSYLRWIGIFLVLGLFIELITRYVPGFQSDFMEKILASSTNRWLLLLGVGIMAPVFEEFMLRGLLLGSMRHLYEEHIAVAITAGVFTLMHLQYNVQIMLLILPMGVLLGYARTRSGSIWVPIVIHVLNNSISVLLT
jgi:uncharacterized protein